MRLGVAFEAVEQHDERRAIRRNGRIEPVEIPEVAIGRAHALAAKGDRGTRQQVRPYRLQMPAGQPRGAAIRSREGSDADRVDDVLTHGSLQRRLEPLDDGLEDLEARIQL